MNGRPSEPDAVLADADYARLKVHVMEQTGLAYYADRDEEFARRVALRMNDLEIKRPGEYLELLSNDVGGGAELDRLAEYLTIGETHFFRHREMFDALREVIIPPLFQEIENRPLRIWSAGCAIGAEAYSAAITLKHNKELEASGRRIFILGTDINRHSLERARRGVYMEWDLRGVSPDARKACFVPCEKGWLVRDEYREGVSFQYHNLVRQPACFASDNLFGFDVIFCRNVLMYFDSTTVRRIVAQLHDSLVEGGWLLVGHAEPNMEVFASFRTVSAPGAILYQKAVEKSQAFDVRGSLPTQRAVDWSARPISRRREKERTLGRADGSKPEATSVPEMIGDEERTSRIRKLADAGDLSAAERCCQQWIRDTPLDAGPYVYLAFLADQRNEREKAMELLRKALYLNPKLAFAHYYMGMLFHRLGMAGKAELSYRTVERLLASNDQEIVPYSDGLTVHDLRRLLESQRGAITWHEGVA